MHIKLYTTSRPSAVQPVVDDWVAGLAETPGREPVTVEVIRKIPDKIKRYRRSDGTYTIDWEWVQDHFDWQPNEGLVFHFTPHYRRKWRVRSSLNGSRHRQFDYRPLFWVCADVGAPASDRNGPGYPSEITELLRLLYHEMAHFDEDQDDLVGDQVPQGWVHELDYEKNAIHTYPAQLPFKDTTIRNRLRDALVELAKRLLSKKKLR